MTKLTQIRRLPIPIEMLSVHTMTGSSHKIHDLANHLYTFQVGGVVTAAVCILQESVRHLHGRMYSIKFRNGFTYLRLYATAPSWSCPSPLPRLAPGHVFC